MSELSVRLKDGDWEVWVDATEGEFEGACIGVGRTERKALEDAIGTCQNFVTDLLNLRERTKTEVTGHVTRRAAGSCGHLWISS